MVFNNFSGSSSSSNSESMIDVGNNCNASRIIGVHIYEPRVLIESVLKVRDYQKTIVVSDYDTHSVHHQL